MAQGQRKGRDQALNSVTSDLHSAKHVGFGIIDQYSCNAAVFGVEVDRLWTRWTRRVTDGDQKLGVNLSHVFIRRGGQQESTSRFELRSIYQLLTVASINNTWILNIRDAERSTSCPP